MNKYKVEIKAQNREYSSQSEARNAMVKLLEAGVFHIKSHEKKEGNVTKPMINLKGENMTFSDYSKAIQSLIAFLKTNELYYIETYIEEDSKK